MRFTVPSALLVILTLAMSGCDRRDGSDSRLIVLDSEELVAENLDMRFEELSRSENISRVRVVYEEGKSVPSALFIARGLYDIAKDRGCPYWITLERNKDPEGNTLYVVGFTNEENPELTAEFGEQYSDVDKDEPGHQISSVEEYKKIFEPEKAFPEIYGDGS